jgi:hypothetical protein
MAMRGRGFEVVMDELTGLASQRGAKPLKTDRDELQNKAGIDRCVSWCREPESNRHSLSGNRF